MPNEKLRIAQIAPLWIPVPPRTYGGIELMVYNLTEELVKRGYDATLFASGDSRTSAKLVSPEEKALWLQKELKNPHAAIIKMLHLIKERVRDFDIIHNHFNFFMFPLQFLEGILPMLTTIRRPMDRLYAETIKLFPKIHFCTLSQDAKKSAEDYGIRVLDFVYNGIDIEAYEFNKTPEDYLFYLGRMNQGKGIMEAIRVAKECGKKLIIAGNIVGAEEWNYFMREIQPLLNEPNINFVGQVDFNEKVKLLKNASALLFPISVREAFGNVMIESMACGTPVIAFPSGSVPEVVVDGKTGFIVENEKEMVEMIGKINSINRSDCREYVEKNFTVKKMTDKYEKIYETILASR